MATKSTKPKMISYVITGTIEMSDPTDMGNAFDVLRTSIEEIRGIGSATCRVNVPAMEDVEIN